MGKLSVFLSAHVRWISKLSSPQTHGTSPRANPMAFLPFRQILPLIVALSIVGGIGFVLYHVYLSVTKMGDAASQKMGKKNVVFTKDGMRVGVKNKTNEKYVDKTQKYVVKAWNLSQQQEYAIFAFNLSSL
ncbi:hypothetical protein NLG97_g2957 [Lecanicillium saksenae]|uniref:Uncharacterized protein n=1 Tax=Lecanicillium saksenae TaxID=468837 RepID=A0ACC1R037_9HYPO|nr:hypothetical protein NLG97_g2957 [Lecanicillium saksenae]